MRTIEQLALEVNDAAKGRPIVSLQTIRQRIRGDARRPTSAIFDRRTIRPDYAFHVGGRSEIQFNIGREFPAQVPELRYGLAFSLEPSRSLPNIDVFVPKIARFNEYVRTYRTELGDLKMWWQFKAGARSPDYAPTEISSDQVKPGCFIFLGARDPESTTDPIHVVTLFDRLLPVYEFVESVGIAFPESPSRSGTFELKAGCSIKPAVTSASLSARTLDVQLRHNELQQVLYRQLSDRHGEGNVGTEVPNGCGGRIDAVVRVGAAYWFYEIKTCSSSRGCIREALPQLLEYAYWPGTQEAQRLIVVGEAALDDESAQFLQTLGTRFSIPVCYEQVVVKC